MTQPSTYHYFFKRYFLLDKRLIQTSLNFLSKRFFMNFYGIDEKSFMFFLMILLYILS